MLFVCLYVEYTTDICLYMYMKYMYMNDVYPSLGSLIFNFRAYVFCGWSAVEL